MTNRGFHKKWEQYIEPGFYGFEFVNESIINYMNQEFNNLINTGFNLIIKNIVVRDYNIVINTNAPVNKTIEWGRKCTKLWKKKL
tara:strand:+ start:156 stop:410 length:255 start_codon:yes stop_codon:yes gene_type:complete